MARHLQSRGHLECFLGEQHPLRKISKLVARFCAQCDLSHHGTDGVQGVTLFAQIRHRADDILGGEWLLHAGEKAESIWRKKCI